MMLDEARADLEARFPPHPDIGNNRLAATGEPYVIITNCGLKQEGASCPAHVSEEFAVNGWFHSVNHYAMPKFGFPLYWRVPPQIERDDKGGWRVYSRLLISDKPQIQPQTLPREAA